jgi:hypothetical protein
MPIEHTRRSDWDSFDDFERAWHASITPRPPKGSMYYDGQFDEIPFYLWDDVLTD